MDTTFRHKVRLLRAATGDWINKSHIAKSDWM